MAYTLFVLLIDHYIHRNAQTMVIYGFANHIVFAGVRRYYFDHQSYPPAGRNEAKRATMGIRRDAHIPEDGEIGFVIALAENTPVDQAIGQHGHGRIVSVAVAEDISEIGAFDLMLRAHGDLISFLGIKHILQGERYFIEIFLALCVSTAQIAPAVERRLFLLRRGRRQRGYQ